MRMKSLVGAAALVIGLAGTAIAETDERITEGNLVKENIPEIPDEISERLRQYSNFRGHGFSDWTEGGIFISTRFGEVGQVHKVTMPLGARRQVTFYDEPVGGASSDPDGDGFVFAKDTGGDEFFQGFYFDSETGEVTQFTEPGTRNGAIAWTDDGEQVAWYRSTAGDPNWDILMADPEDPSSLRVVHEGEGALYPVDFSADGKKLA
ncbi:MAG: S9 family peptidase, partial [Pseudomonadota bacterium]